MKFAFLFVVCTTALSTFPTKAQQAPVYKNDGYAVYADRVTQGSFTAKALTDKHIISDYESPENDRQSPLLEFKFSINRKDNEMRPGVNHRFYCAATNGNCETPLIKFGTELSDSNRMTEKTFLAANISLKIRVDMREVLNAFKKDGFYRTFNGEKIYAADFKELYVAGSTSPMVWDFDNLHQRPQLQLKDPDGDGIYETTVILNETKKEKDLAGEWKLTKDISAFPQYHSEYVLSDAIYNMSLEEMQNAIEPDSTFQTGKEWAGVWTRDISYSIILSMAYLQPAVAKYSLLKKVKNGRIIQDTGTGGAYPNSTDRIVWAVAAWELYKVTADKDWLQQAYTIIKNSVDDDVINAYDKVTGMVRGESSFLDWREQTYPKWMQPADIFESECLGTNAVHYQANMVLSEMATLLNKAADSKKYAAQALQIKNGINKYLWMEEKGFYAQYLYGNNYRIRSPKSEALGESLAVIFGIATAKQQQSVIAKTPVTSFGLPCIFPQIQNLPAYHNNAIWPFVQSYWAQAAARAGNNAAVLESIAAIYRPAAMFVTNKENFVVDNGDYKGTVINSSNMLWSLSGNISLIYKVLFGIDFRSDGLSLKPFVPYELKGIRTLNNFHFRKAILNITLSGYGNKIKNCSLDGKPLTAAFISEDLSGNHTLDIVLAGNNTGGKINETKNEVAPETPSPNLVNDQLSWPEIGGVITYKILRNGAEISRTSKTNVSVPTAAYSEYQVVAIDKTGNESFASQPQTVKTDKTVFIDEMENYAGPATGFSYKGFSGKGFVEISKKKNTAMDFPLNITQDGVYAIDFSYANGNGPTNTENKCCIRSLREGKNLLGAVIFPQRGIDEWSNWGASNPVQCFLKAGRHLLTLSLDAANENMNGDINQAMLDYFRVIRLK